MSRFAAVLQHQPGLAPRVTHAVAAGTRSAEDLATVLAPLAETEAELRAARYRRDAIGDRWDGALTTLKLGVRMGERKVAPGLYAALFARLARRRPKQRKARSKPAAN